MKRNIIYNACVVAVLIVTAMTASCMKELPLPEVKSEKKLVLLGEFVAGDSFLLRVGQSSGMSGGTVKTEILKDAVLTIKDSAGSEYEMTGEEDDLTTTLFTIPYKLPQQIKNGGVYTVTAKHPSLGMATAIVHIPKPIDAVIADTASRLYASDMTLHIKVKLNDPGNTANYYVIEAVKQLMNIDGYFFYEEVWRSMIDESELYYYLKGQGTSVPTRYDTSYISGRVRQSLYTSDGISENAVDNGLLTRAKRVLVKDATFNGATHEVDVYVVQAGYDAFLGDIRGRTIVYVKSVSEDYFKFLKAYEIYTPSSINATSEQPVKIPGNVQNGLGILGGASQIKFEYINDSWEF